MNAEEAKPNYQGIGNKENSVKYLNIYSFIKGQKGLFRSKEIVPVETVESQSQ